MLYNSQSTRNNGGFVNELTRRPSFSSSCLNVLATLIVAAPVIVASYSEYSSLDPWADQLSNNLKLGVMCLAGGEVFASCVNVLSLVTQLCTEPESYHFASDGLSALGVLTLIGVVVISKSIQEAALDNHFGRFMGILFVQVGSAGLNEIAIRMGACLENAPTQPLLSDQNQGSACAGRLGVAFRFLTNATGLGPVTQSAARLTKCFAKSCASTGQSIGRRGVARVASSVKQPNVGRTGHQQN